MLQTRHVVIGAGILLGVLTLVLVGTFAMHAPKSIFATYAELQLASPIEAVGIVAEETDPRKEIRESLRARLLASGGRTAQVIEEEVPDLGESKETLPEQKPVLSGLMLGGNAVATPSRDAIYACTVRSSQTTLGLPWVREGRWYSDERPIVDGSNFLESSVSVGTAEGARVMLVNSIPQHAIGDFPVTPLDDAHPFRGSEAVPKPLTLSLQLPLYPQVSSAPACVSGKVVGIAKNGVLIYSGLDENGGDAGVRSVTDRCGGTTDSMGTYHYIRENACLVDAYYEGGASTLLGFALDGFGIFASIENGEKLTNTELDECHGHTHDIPWNDETFSMYHYHMTDEYPYSVGCFRGIPVSIPVN